jgi:TonB family protein
LNAKASVHAVFVRRVAIQVFSNLRASGWEQLRASDVQAMTEETTVRAVLSPTGRLLRASLERSSGSPRFDEVLEAAVRRGARDPNPPKAAALKDGNIHFVFKARSWVMTGSDPRTGALRERRWLVLGTGLE